MKKVRKGRRLAPQCVENSNGGTALLLLHFAGGAAAVAAHLGFLHIALAVKDVPSAAAHIVSKDAETAATKEEKEAAAPIAGTAGSRSQLCSTAGSEKGAQFGATEVIGDVEDVFNLTVITSRCTEKCLLHNFIMVIEV